jgi:hypothetical protein
MQDFVSLYAEYGALALVVGAFFYGYFKQSQRADEKEKVEDTLKRFDEKHENLQHRLDIIMDELGKVKKWNAEIKSDLKVYIDLTLKGK